MLRITIDGEVVVFDDNKLMISEAILLHKVARMDRERMFAAFRIRTCDEDSCDKWTHEPSCDPTTHKPCQPCEVDGHKREQDHEGIKALFWLALRRAKGDQTPKYSEFDFDMGASNIEALPDDEPEAARDGEQNPTSARKGPTSRKRSTPTSRSSPTSSASTRGTSTG